jgi:PilZ domain-containing protein
VSGAVNILCFGWVSVFLPVAEQTCAAKWTENGEEFDLRANQERRRSARITPDPFLIIRLPQGNQGVVLDVSSEGLGFLAASPVEENAPFPFELTTRSQGAVTAAGRLAWKDASGKRGGLRFTELPADAEALVHRAMGLAARPHLDAPQGFLPAGSLLAALEEENRDLRSRIERIEKESALASEPAAEPGGKKRLQRQMLAANILTLGLAGFVALAIWYSFGYSINGRQARAVLARLRAPMAGLWAKEAARAASWKGLVKAEITRAGEKPAAAAAAIPREAPEPASGRAAVETAEPFSARPENAAGPEMLQPAVEKTETVDGSPAGAPEKSFDEAARESLKPAAPASEPKTLTLSTQAESAAANANASVQALWQAVEKGDAAAEVELAGRYLTGRGVAKNCNQAAVLLSAAQGHKNALAGEKLKGLAEYGCGAPQSSATAGGAAREGTRPDEMPVP